MIKNTKRAFTLFELLIAISTFSILLYFWYASINSFDCDSRYYKIKMQESLYGDLDHQTPFNNEINELSIKWDIEQYKLFCNREYYDTTEIYSQETFTGSEVQNSSTK